MNFVALEIDTDGKGFQTSIGYDSRSQPLKDMFDVARIDVHAEKKDADSSLHEELPRGTFANKYDL
jgi:hypothetical protein